MTNFKEITFRNPAWMKKQHELPCEICGETGSTVGAHQRLAGLGGTALKSPDNCTIPLCHKHHQEEHRGWNTFYVEMLRIWPLFLKHCLLARAREIYRSHFADPGEIVLLDALKEYRKLSDGPGGAIAHKALEQFKEMNPQKNLWYRPPK